MKSMKFIIWACLCIRFSVWSFFDWLYLFFVKKILLLSYGCQNL